MSMLCDHLGLVINEVIALTCLTALVVVGVYKRFFK